MGSNAQDVFAAVGNVTYQLGGGKDYSGGVPATGTNGGMSNSLGNLKTSYRTLREQDDEIAVDYLIMGPGCRI